MTTQLLQVHKTSFYFISFFLVTFFIAFIYNFSSLQTLLQLHPLFDLAKVVKTRLGTQIEQNTDSKI